MDAKDIEELLWKLAAEGATPGEKPPGGEEEPGPAPGDEVLEAYRAGRLDANEEREVERVLARNHNARQRLMTLAGIDLPASPSRPSPRARRRILAAMSQTPRQDPRLWWAAAAAAAVLLAVLGYPLILTPDLPDDLHFDVTVRGRAAVRSEPAPGSSVTVATPETLVSITVEPRTTAVAGLAMGLYRQAGTRLLRLDPQGELDLETGRGAARFSAPAAVLVGTEPGAHEVFIAVGWEGDLPSELELDSDRKPQEQLAAGARRRVYGHVIHLLPLSPP